MRHGKGHYRAEQNQATAEGTHLLPRNKTYTHIVILGVRSHQHTVTEVTSSTLELGRMRFRETSRSKIGTNFGYRFNRIS